MHIHAPDPTESSFVQKARAMQEASNSKQLVSYFIIVAIAVVFAVQWGPGAKGCGRLTDDKATTAAATVNGKEISLREFARAYNGQLNWMRSQGNPLSESVAEQMGLPKQVLDQLVNSELLQQAAAANGIGPSDDEIRELIHKNTDFQKDGAFDFDRYTEVVRDYYRKTVPEYESDTRKRLAAQKLLDIVEAGATVSDDEVRARYDREADKASVNFVRFSSSLYADKVSKVSDTELATYEKEHEKEISDYYESNKFLYSVPEKVRARHILFKVDKNADAAKKAEAQKKAESLRTEIMEQNKDFAEMAKQHSEDPGSKGNGGDLGFNERSAWVPEFATTAFSLNPGEVSMPVESPFGVHLIKVEEKKPAETKDLKDVQGEIARQLYAKAKAKELARTEAEKALAAVKSGKKLAAMFPAPKEDAKDEGKPKIEAAKKPELVESGEFNASADSVPKLGGTKDLVREILRVKEPHLIDRPLEIGEGFAVVEVTLRTLPSDEGFAAQKDSLRNEATRAKAMELQDSYVKALRKVGVVTTNEAALSRKASD